MYFRHLENIKGHSFNKYLKKIMAIYIICKKRNPDRKDQMSFNPYIQPMISVLSVYY